MVFSCKYTLHLKFRIYPEYCSLAKALLTGHPCLRPSLQTAISRIAITKVRRLSPPRHSPSAVSLSAPPGGGVAQRVSSSRWTERARLPPAAPSAPAAASPPAGGDRRRRASVVGVRRAALPARGRCLEGPCHAIIIIIIITLIIIITEMAVFNVAGYLIEKAQVACNLLLPHVDNIPNKLRILKERHVQMRKPYQFPGWTKNSSYYN